MSTVSLATLLEKNKHLSLTPANRIKCSYSGHEMPARADAVQQYLQSKKFQKMKEWYSQDFSKYEPLIVQDKSDPKKLYCTLTKKSLNKIPEEVDKHISGKKFLRLKAEGENKQKKHHDDSDEELDIWVPPEEVLNEEEEAGEEEAAAVSDSEDDEVSDSEEYAIPSGKKSKQGNGKRKQVEEEVESEDEDVKDHSVATKGKISKESKPVVERNKIKVQKSNKGIKEPLKKKSKA